VITVDKKPLKKQLSKEEKAFDEAIRYEEPSSHIRCPKCKADLGSNNLGYAVKGVTYYKVYFVVYDKNKVSTEFDEDTFDADKKDGKYYCRECGAWLKGVDADKIEAAIKEVLDGKVHNKKG